MFVHILRNGNLQGDDHTTSSLFSAVPRSPRKGVALRLVSTKDMEREDWLEVRRTGIGSSDAAAAIGLNPYQSQLELWMQKTGKADLLPTVDRSDDSSPMFWGTLLEPIVAAHYTKRTGNKVRRVNAVLQHPEHPWMLANVDREVVGASMRRNGTHSPYAQ
ncbi:UNVERIFIED_ORG: putative phage-type endonuclease [Comamonas terrigena]